MDTLTFILNKYNLTESDKPVKLMCTRWGTLPKLFRQLQFTVGAEIGVLDGTYAEFLCKYNPNGKLYAVDPWEGYKTYLEFKQDRLSQAYANARKLLAPYHCHFIRAYSMDAVRRFADASLDYVYIDAAHDYEHVKEDIREWEKKVKKGGIISGHDYYNGRYSDVAGMYTDYGVKQAVNESLQGRMLFLLKKRGDSSWFYVK